MRPVAPRTGAPEVTLAEEQLEYAPLVVALYCDAQGNVGPDGWLAEQCAPFPPEPTS